MSPNVKRVAQTIRSSEITANARTSRRKKWFCDVLDVLIERASKGGAQTAAALANNGEIIRPCLAACGEQSKNKKDVQVAFEYFKIVKEGMRMAVTSGTATALDVYGVEIAAKTGTSEIGAAKKYVNSWVIGFFPYQNPKYSFAVVLERGPEETSGAATSVMRRLLDWMSIYTAEYLR